MEPFNNAEPSTEAVCGAQPSFLREASHNLAHTMLQKLAWSFVKHTAAFHSNTYDVKYVIIVPCRPDVDLSLVHRFSTHCLKLQTFT